MLVTSFLRRQVVEIASDPALRGYGIALSLINVLAAVFWLVGEIPLHRILDPAAIPVCWPFFEECFRARSLDPEQINIALLLYALAAIATSTLFMSPRTVTAAVIFLALLSALKYWVIFLDFRLTLNHHYMSLWILLTYLLAPMKRRSLQYVMIAFYLWAGILKLDPNAEWLTGAAFYGRRPLSMPASLIPTACFYVIVLELFGSPLLTTRSRGLFSLVITQFFLFHVASAWVVGFFYPCLMFLLLSIFLLSRAVPSVVERAQYAGRREAGYWTRLRRSFIVPALLSACQLIPRIIPGDSAFTGEGRLFALNMFDAPMDCRATLQSRGPEGRAGEISAMRAPFLTTRIMCDPIVYLSLTKTQCRLWSKQFDFDLTLESRRLGQRSYQRVVSLQNVCSINPHYSVFRRNWWIEPPNN